MQNHTTTRKPRSTGSAVALGVLCGALAVGVAGPEAARAGEAGAASIEGPRDDIWEGMAAGKPRPLARVPFEVADLHVDTPHQLVRRGGYSLKKKLPFLQIDVPRLRAGNVKTQFFALWPPPAAVKSGRANAYCRRALQALRTAAAESGALVLAANAAEGDAARAQGKIAAFVGMEGAECLMGKVENLAAWRKEGLSYLGLTWNFPNAFAMPATPRRGARPNGTASGLSDAGRALVAEAERLGVLVDVSHASERTFWDVYRAARRPFIASHSSSASLRAHPRNLDDEQARAVARAGGVIGVNFHRPFVKAGRRVTVDDVADHVVHLVRVAGARHVALGSDFDGNIAVPERLEDPAQLGNLVDALRARGLKDDALRLVFGKNVLRVLREQARADLHEGTRRVPLAVAAVTPARARRLVDRNERTRLRVPKARGPHGSIRFRVAGQPTHLAVSRCDAKTKATVELLRGREVVARQSFEGEALREERALTELAGGHYDIRISGSGCLSEVTLYGP